ncbi:MAG: hypothetical protein AAB405_02740 [Patescibacteria group bacterium]
MNNKFIKQIIFGSFFLIILFLIGFAVFLIFFKQPPSCFDKKQNQNETGIDCGGSCPACELKTVRPLETNWVRFFSGEGKAIIGAEIKNPNQNYASDNFSINFDILDKYGKKIKGISKISSFIYASDIKCLIEFTDIDYLNIGDVKISFSNVNWLAKDEFSKPAIQIREFITKTLSGNSEIEISGIALNDNNYPLSLIRIIAFLNNSSGIKIGASKTELDNISAYGERQFKIVFPENISLWQGPLAGDANTTSTIFDFGSADKNKTQICIEGKR